MVGDGGTKGWKQYAMAFSSYIILQQHPVMKSFVNKFGGGEEAIPGCFHPIVPPSPTICLKIQFLVIYPHLRLLLGDSLTTLPLSLTKMLSLDAVAIVYKERRLFQAVLTPLPANSGHLPDNSIFGHLPPFAPAYGQPLDPTSTFIDKNVITGCYCNNIYGE